MRVGPLAVGLALVILASGCSLPDSTTSSDDFGSDIAAGTAGSTDGGSFVGNPGAGNGGEAFGGDDGDADGTSGDDDAGAGDSATEDDDSSAAPGVEGPGLSTDPDKVYVAGTCFRSDPSVDDREAVEVRCDEPHSIEIYAIVDLPGDEGAPFLGLDAAIGLCNQDFLQITGVGLGLATIYQRSVLRPSEETWADGERDVTCYVEYPVEISESLVNVDPVRGFGQVSIYGLEVGDCFIDFDDTETTFEPVSCDEPHDAEVFVDFEYPPGAYPGDDVIDQTADELCFGKNFEDFIGLDYQSSSIFALRSRPTEETWNLGDRTINCVLTDELVRTGSLEGSGI